MRRLPTRTLEYVELNSWQLRKTEAVIEAAERGDFASDEEVARVRAKFAANSISSS